MSRWLRRCRLLLLLGRAREPCGLRRLLLLLLLLELLLVLGRNRGHRRRACLVALLRLSLSREPCVLRLLGLRLLLHAARVAGDLLLERRLAEACGLRSETAGLLASLLALLASHCVERTSILGRARPLIAGATEEGVGVRIHRDVELPLLLRHSVACVVTRGRIRGED